MFHGTKPEASYTILGFLFFCCPEMMTKLETSSMNKWKSGDDILPSYMGLIINHKDPGMGI